MMKPVSAMTFKRREDIIMPVAGEVKPHERRFDDFAIAQTFIQPAFKKYLNGGVGLPSKTPRSL